MRFFVSILIILFSLNVAAQYSISQELRFINHMVNQEEYDDVIYYIENHFNKDYPLSVRDSLNFFKGWSQYAIKKLEYSASSLLQVSSNSVFFNKSRFFAAYNFSHLGRPNISGYILNNLKTEGRFNNLKNFQLAGNALLSRSLNDFETSFQNIGTTNDFSFSIEKEKLNEYALEIKDHRDKSMLVGGLMSAIIPGSGKIYAGKTGEGIASFLIIAASGATALENYNKLGIKNAKTILFGSLFAVLYIGNIYGTVFTVKLVNEEFNHEMDHKILFNMHIPLRNIFN
ncbi:MAG: hypothetical protein JXR31_11065 [Prolixibacteraceae bacterium]|nr:hypothetical protein [Prolixibacteraceae bacterium]MBN2774782.1 hypothetical protein [Prolixibacteraceae bacterium]